MKLLLVFFLIFSFSSQANTDDKINITQLSHIDSNKFMN